MTGDDFSLDINNPKEPKILVVGNNPDRQNIYSAALGLYNSRIVKLINKKGQLKSSVIIDELPTIYFRGLDNLIATARSNKVAVLLGFQDYSQLTRDYGDKESRVIQNTVGNVFSGQVVGETAKILSERFGKVLQKRQSMTINQREKSTSISTQMDSLIPASKISNLTQGMFVGAVADNFDERIEQKIFHCEIVVDNEKVKRETARYVKLPQIIDFTDKDGNDRMQEEIQANYDRIRQEVRQIKTVIQNTVGNVFSGQVVGETAKILSERFGKVLQKRQSMTINQREKSTSISTQMDSLIPASKISNLTQGMFVGAVADNFDERIEQKIFHCEIVVDNEKVKRETARYVKLPQIIDFTDKDGNDRMQEEIQANYDRIRQEVKQIVEDEITRIKNDPELCHLIKEEE